MKVTDDYISENKSTQTIGGENDNIIIILKLLLSPFPRAVLLQSLIGTHEQRFFFVKFFSLVYYTFTLRSFDSNFALISLL